MARVIEAVQIFKKVEDVTSPKDDPPPVYLMDELADMARGSFESAEKIAGRIAKHLEHKSPVVKYKALRLTRHIANKGSGNFQRAMQKHLSAVRGLVHFKGEPDPFKGDTANQRVRDAAKEAAEALANTVMTQPVNSLGSRIQGFGSGAAPPPSSSSSNNSGSGGGGGGSAASGTSGRMVGFGSSGYSAPTGPSNGGSSGNGFGYGSSQRGVNRPLTGGYGGDAGAAGPGQGGSNGGGYGGGYSAPTVTASGVLGSEDQLVEGICTPGGLRLAPDPDDLRRFVEAIGSLDGLRVAELLRDKMDGSGPWQQLLRALYALEAVLLQGATQACGEIAVMFQSDPGPVQAAATSSQAAVRERAGSVLRLLLGEDATASTQQAVPAAGRGSGAQAAPPGASAPTAVDLLGGLDMLGSPVQAGHGTQPGLSQHRPEDIFANLPVPSGPQGMDPFAVNVLGSSVMPTAHAGAAQYLQAQPQQQQQRFSQTQQLHPQLQQQQLGQGMTGVGGGVGPGLAGAGVLQPGASHGPVRPPAMGASAPAPRNMAAPLDDLFSDMTIAGPGPGHVGPGAGTSAGYGVGGAFPAAMAAYGGAGGQVARAGPGSVAAPSAYGTGQATPALGGSKPGSQLDLLGMGGGGGGGGGPQAPQYGAPYGGPGLGGQGAHGGMGMMGIPQAQQQPWPQQAPQPAATPAPPGTAGGGLLGSYDPGLRAGPGPVGPAAGYSGAGFGGYGTGVATGPGTGSGMGGFVGSGASSSGTGLGAPMGMGPGVGSMGGMGMGAGIGAGMMVGPGGQTIPGAVEAFNYFRERHIPWLFVTNTTTKPRDGSAALFVAPEVVQEFAGVQLLPPGAESGAGVVVIGDMGSEWSYRELNRAFRYFKDVDGLSLDVGPFTAALEFAADEKAIILGKPDPLIFRLAAESLGLEASEVVMVGDDVRGDVGGAQAAGLRGLLVRTGKFRPEDLQQGVAPDGLLASIAELPAWWEAQQVGQGQQGEGNGQGHGRARAGVAEGVMDIARAEAG
ncbi:hypothetical protein GPECTOR_7g1208 [Gonium pectorale]|uniref:ENTH domain-containing protein n=1 Tax=Gonium pectorale TaxID=33097 RepID=A0A150GU55_GONPE|nr:hypothetical protein GPECTOR_7g1208 [Gonium pectorale]|eukprot:KXZ53314.1 hypothetical protein GPECTOR_7g1208 [Gonium pectorale]